MADKPIETITLKNGALADAKTHKIVKASEANKFDSASGRAAALRRRELMQEKTRQGIIEAIEEKKNIKIADYPEAHKEIVKTITKEVVMDSLARGSDRVKAMESIVSMEGSMGNVRKPEREGQPGITIHLSPEIAEKAVQRVLEWQASKDQVIDGEFSEDSN